MERMPDGQIPNEDTTKVDTKIGCYENMETTILVRSGRPLSRLREHWEVSLLDGTK